jgi:hypothetical protein
MLSPIIISAPGTGVAEKTPDAGPVSGTGEPAAAESPPAASRTEARYRSCVELSKNIPGPLSIAVISIAAANQGEGEFAAEELTFLLVNLKKYSIVDRSSLDIIRAEQRFQLSGEVDDDTAVSIGHLIGAAVVITGNINPYGEVKYLRLKALDVETGEIRAMVSWRFAGEPTGASNESGL